MAGMDGHRIVLLRHAQASWGGADYDLLSERGRAQAVALGDWLAAASPWNFTSVWRGRQRRHADTLGAIEHACLRSGHALPPATVAAEWDEFDPAALLAAFRARAPDHPVLSALRHAPTPGEAKALLAAVFDAWRRGALDDGVSETWPAFATRIAAARTRVVRESPPGAVLVVSSGGVIARCAQAALDLDDARMIELNLGLANSALSEFTARDDHWSLLSWNTLPHLAGGAVRALASHY